MNNIGVVVSSNEFSDRNQLANYIQTLINEDNDLEVHTIYPHKDWQKGEPCPECNSRDMRHVSASEDYMISNNGTLTPMEPGACVGSTISAHCRNCDQRLFERPVELV